MRSEFALIVCLAVPTVADVITVGPDPSDDHGKVQAAVNIAADGDLIFVRPGHLLGSVKIDGKSLTIVGEPGVPFPPLYAGGPWTIQNLGPEQAVSLWGLRLVGPVDQAALVVRFNQGPVRISDCQIRGGSGLNWLNPAGTGCYVTQSADVTLVDCNVDGGYGYSNPYGECSLPGPGGPGLRVRNSTVDVFGGDLTGGHGGDDDGVFICQGYGDDGGPGLDNIDGAVRASGTSLLGGIPGAGSDGSGQPGASAVFGTPQATLTLLGAPAPDGVPPGTVVLDPIARRIEAPAPTSAGPTPLVVHGAPGELALLRVRVDVNATKPILQSQGTLLAGGGATILAGTLDANGRLDLRLAPPPLPFGALGAAHALHAFVITPLGTLSAGAVPWIVLDPGL